MNWEDLVAALAAAPTLTGARCHSAAPLFDAEFDDIRAETITEQADRHERAKAICSACPALDACRAWANAADPGVLAGVVAGEFHEATSYGGKVPFNELNSTRLSVIRFVSDRQGTTVASDVASALGISRNTATRVLLRAAAAGHIGKQAPGMYCATSLVQEAVGA